MRIKGRGGCARGFGQPSVSIMIRTTAGRDRMADSTLRYRHTTLGGAPLPVSRLAGADWTARSHWQAGGLDGGARGGLLGLGLQGGYRLSRGGLSLARL